MQPQGQFNRILDICKSFSQDFLNSCGNLQHCGRKPRCSDVEIIALSLFQEFLSIDSECLFFDTMQSLLPDLALRMGSRRNYNARRHPLRACRSHPETQEQISSRYGIHQTVNYRAAASEASCFSSHRLFLGGEEGFARSGALGLPGLILA